MICPFGSRYTQVCGAKNPVSIVITLDKAPADEQHGWINHRERRRDYKEYSRANFHQNNDNSV